MNTKAKGSRRERQYRKFCEADGWMVVRPGASLGPADLVLMRRSELTNGTAVVLSQVKANSGSPWMNFRKDERRELVAAAEAINAEAELVHWPPNGAMRIYLPPEWP